MSWVGTAYCDYCEQFVDVYTDDCETFECGFCGRPIQFNFEEFVEKPSELSYEQEDLILEEGLEKWRERKRSKEN